MYLKNLNITKLRNLQQVQLSLSKNINAFYGPNGSGKTSLLEAIYVLGLGRSFRTPNLQQVINFNAKSYVISAVVTTDENTFDYRIGTEKHKEQAKVNFSQDQKPCHISSIAKLLPIALINSDSLNLISGGPAYRREFIDLVMFHVEQNFLVISHKFKRCLAQRNAELKAKNNKPREKIEISAWDEIFIETANQITKVRNDFLVEFNIIFNNLLSNLQYNGKIKFKYKQGWPEHSSLEHALANNYSLDLMTGYTNCGPHRAELEISIDGIPIKSVLSRGQQKIFVCAMILAKTMLLQQKTGTNSIFLVDDLQSELDKQAYLFVMQQLRQIGGQIFLTGLDKKILSNSLELLESSTGKLFHVEQFGVLLQTF